MAGLDPAIHALPALLASVCLRMNHHINILVASVSVHVDGRVKPGHDEKPNDRCRKEINNSNRYKSQSRNFARRGLGPPRRGGAFSTAGSWFYVYSCAL